MKRDQFIRVLSAECERAGRRLLVDRKLGKGSHYRLEIYSGKDLVAKTTLKSGDLSPLYERLIRKQLGLD